MVITKPARMEMHVLEREDFVMFGFFTGLGRSTSAYLAARGVRDMEESLSRLLKSVVLVKCIQLFLHALCEPIKKRWICLVSILVGVAYSFFHRITEVFPADLLMVIKRAKYMDGKKKQATLLQGGFEVFLSNYQCKIIETGLSLKCFCEFWEKAQKKVCKFLSIINVIEKLVCTNSSLKNTIVMLLAATTKKILHPRYSLHNLAYKLTMPTGKRADK
jgi:hypothetical protein